MYDRSSRGVQEHRCAGPPLRRLALPSLPWGRNRAAPFQPCPRSASGLSFPAHPPAAAAASFGLRPCRGRGERERERGQTQLSLRRRRALVRGRLVSESPRRIGQYSRPAQTPAGGRASRSPSSRCSETLECPLEGAGIVPFDRRACPEKTCLLKRGTPRRSAA